MSMNRQLRRAQEKQEKKLEKDKEERRAERRKRLDQLRAQRQKRAEDAVAKRRNKADGGSQDKKGAAQPAAPAKPSANDPGRFSGAFAIATVFFIIMQGVVPTEAEQQYESFIKAGFYLMLGYFLTLWLLRRGHAQAFVLSIMAGIILLTGTWLGFLLRPEAVLDPVAMILALPLLLVGSWLARLVYNMAQRQNQG